MDKMLLEMDQITDYLREIKSRERIIVIAGEVYVLKHPTVGIMHDSKILLEQLTQEYIKQGVATRAQARALLIKAIKDSGKDPQVLEHREGVMKRLVENLKDIVPQEKVMEAFKSPEMFSRIMQQAYLKLSPEDAAVMQQAADVDELEVSIMGNCVESLAASQKDDYIMIKCVTDSTGKFVWEDFNAYINETRLEIVADIKMEFKRFMDGLPLLFEATIPEGIQPPQGFPTQAFS